MRIKACILFFILTITTVQAQNFLKEAQFNLGLLLPSDSISMKLEYPQYKRLTSSQVKQLRAEGFEAKTDVDFHFVRSISRKQTVVDVSFYPIVRKGNDWYEIISYDLKPIVHSSLKYSSIRKMLTIANAVASSQRYASHSVLAKGKWIKISVDKEGVYQLNEADLRKAGFSDITKVRLYGYGGQLIKENFSFTGKDGLIDDLNEIPLYRRSNSLLFYAVGTTRYDTSSSFTINTFSEKSYYFLTEAEDGETAAEFKTLSQPTDATTEVTTISTHALVNNEKTLWYQGGRKFFDDIELNNGHTYKLSLPGNTGATCQVAYDLAISPTSSSPSFTLTNTSTSQTLASGYFGKLSTGQEAKGYANTFNATFDDEASINVKTTDEGHLNYLYITYQQTLSTLCTTTFTAGKSGAVEMIVENADANTRVWRLDNAENQAAELPGTLNGSTYHCYAPDGTENFVVVNTSQTFSSPAFEGSIENQDLHADSCYDYIIIIPSSGKLQAQAERLAEYHHIKNSLKVKVVRADQIYNEFSSGTPDASAYRRYLKMLYDRATNDNQAPRYLLLFGDCSYDNRMITSAWKKSSSNDYLLAYERSDEENRVGSYGLGTLNDYVTDDYYGFLDDGEGRNITTDKLDLGIGRFLCHTATDAEWLVDQAIRYMENKSVGPWKNRLWAIGDVGDNNLHMNDAQAVCKQITQSANEGLMLRRIYPDAYVATTEAKGTTYPEATEKIKLAMQRGALVFNYNGHGRPERLSYSFLLDESDMTNNVSNSLPLWLFASCEITPYDQDITDLGREALFCKTGPALGVICASRSVYATYNCALNKVIYKYIFAKDGNNQRNSISEALRLAKNELVTSKQNTIGTDYTINKLKYAYFGDPAIQLSYADDGVVIDSINGAAISSTSTSLEQLAIGTQISFSGYVQNTNGSATPNTNFNGTLYASIYAPEKTITCQGRNSNNALTYQDYTQTLFEGNVKVTNGRFQLNVVIPRGTTLSEEAAKLSLYAVNDNCTEEYNGAYKQFCFSKNGMIAEVDSIGPKIYPYFNTPDFPSGGAVSPSGTFYARITDPSGISMMSGNLGHNMEMWLDNNSDDATDVSDYFQFDNGSYSEGLLEYPFSDLTLGHHTIYLRAWDVYDNHTLSQLTFNVTEKGASNFDVNATEAIASQSTRFITTYANEANTDVAADVQTEVYSITGVRIWHGNTQISAGGQFAALDWDLTDYSGAKLGAGLYLYRSVINGKNTSTKRLIIK